MLYLLSGSPILIAAGAIPALVLLVYIYRQDRLEREPASLLLKLVMFGILSTFLASITEGIGIRLTGSAFPENSLIYNLIVYYIFVACSEEGFKYVLLKKITWKDPEFDCQFDGIVYAVFVSLGFALWENIAYVVMYGFEAAVMRAVTAVPGHCSFAVLMGAFYGMAKKYDYNKEFSKARFYRFLAVLAPILVHGTYDFIATLGQNYTLIFFIFIILVFIYSFRLIRNISKNDDFINETHSDYVAPGRKVKPVTTEVELEEASAEAGMQDM